VNGTKTVLDSRSASVTLVAGPPIIYSLSLSNTTLEIGGKTETFTAGLRNQGAPRSGIWLKAEVIQGTNSGIVGGRYILCPGETTIGLLPTGDCTFSSSVAVPASAPFVPGAATFLLSMYHVENDVLTLLHSFSLPVTLVAAPSPPSITSLSVSPSTLVIDGPLATWTADFQNPGSALTGMTAQAYIVVGTDTVPANGVSVNCPSYPLGTLPSGSCTMSWTTSAQSSAINGDKLVPGSATFLLDLFQTANNATTLLASKTFPITLASGTPTITSVDFDASVPRRSDDGTVILLISQSSSNGYTATIDNPGGARTGMGIQAEIHQGSVVHGAGGATLVCGNGTATPGTPGELPNGTCVMQFNTTASNTTAGNGDLIEGYADWVLYLDNLNGDHVASITVRVYLAQQQF
jgi:hypothetical protein